MADGAAFTWFANPRAEAPPREALPEEGFRAARAEIASWPGYAATPLVDCGPIAQAAGVAEVRIEDESGRFGLGSFETLGGASAVARLVAAEGGGVTVTSDN